MLKSSTSDEMELASELCLSTALTYPVPCLLEISQQLVDYVLFVTGPQSVIDGIGIFRFKIEIILCCKFRFFSFNHSTI